MEVDLRMACVLGLIDLCFSDGLGVAERIAECEESGICFRTIKSVEEGDLKRSIIEEWYYFSRNTSPLSLSG